MTAYAKEESVQLLHNESKGSNSIKDAVLVSSGPKCINLKEAFFIMVGYSLGAGIIIQPFTIQELGVVAWICTLVVVVAIQTLCGYLLKTCTEEVSENQLHATVRDPYQTVAQVAGGYHLRRFSVVIMYIADISTCISLLLLAASILANFAPIGALTYANHIRVWITFIIVVLTPIMYLGTYSELKLPAFIALVTSLTSACGIIINCIIKQYFYPHKESKLFLKKANFDQNSLVSLGTIIFISIGPLQTISNITVLASNPRRLHRSIFSCFVCLLLVYVVMGLVPYFIFNGEMSSSILATFHVTMKRYPMGAGFKTTTMLVEVLMVFHLLFASLLSVNPVFLHLEEVLDVPRQLNWKRVAIRTSVMLFILGICLLIPEFEFAVGISGGVPLTILGIMLPAFMYSKIFEISKPKRISIYVFLVVILFFSLGNLISSIFKLLFP